MPLQRRVILVCLSCIYNLSDLSAPFFEANGFIIIPNNAIEPIVRLTNRDLCSATAILGAGSNQIGAWAKS